MKLLSNPQNIKVGDVVRLTKSYKKKLCKTGDRELLRNSKDRIYTVFDIVGGTNSSALAYCICNNTGERSNWYLWKLEQIEVQNV